MDNKKFIVRFDDLCPTINWDTWGQIEYLLDKYNIKPIIAVIPDNQDKSLMYQEERSDFWDLIRAYQQKGWMIALHGYNHVYTNHKSGIMGISANSEFSGLSYDFQKKKIGDGLDIFKNAGVRVDAFIAPSHSFDSTTLKVLAEYGINTISDGHIEVPYKHKGFLWIPCQLWEHFKVSKNGVYTVCYHHNKWNENDFNKFKLNIEKNCKNIICPFDIELFRPLSLVNLIRTYMISFRFRFKRLVKKIIRYKK